MKFLKSVFLIFSVTAGSFLCGSEVFDQVLPDAHAVIYVNCGRLLKDLSPEYQQFIQGAGTGSAASGTTMSMKDEMLISIKLLSPEPFALAADGVLFSSGAAEQMQKIIASWGGDIQKNGGTYDPSFKLGNEPADRFTIAGESGATDLAVSKGKGSRKLFRLRCGTIFPVSTPLGIPRKCAVSELLRQHQAGMVFLIASPGKLAATLAGVPAYAAFSGILNQLEYACLQINGKAQFLELKLHVRALSSESAAMLHSMLQPLLQQKIFLSGSSSVCTGKEISLEAKFDLAALANIKNMSDMQKKE